MPQYLVIWEGAEWALHARDEEDAKLAIAGPDSHNAVARPLDEIRTELCRIVARRSGGPK